MGRTKRGTHPGGMPPFFPKKFLKRAAVVLASLAVLLSAKFFPAKGYEDIAVTHVYDGDTVKLANGERVRFIGIDCPEMHDNDKLFADARRTGQDIETIKDMGRRSYEFVKFVNNRRVRLEFDVQRRDKYGRLLAYVYLWPAAADQALDPKILEFREFSDKEGNVSRMIFLNATIVKAGYANLMTIPPNTAQEGFFKELYQEARQAHRGLWKATSESSD